MSLHRQPPWDGHDAHLQAKNAHNHPARRASHALADENLRLKRLLRENGIAWSPVAQNYLQRTNPVKRNTRQAKKAKEDIVLRVPTEVLLRIAKFALTSRYTIVDPLLPLQRENLTVQEQSRRNQIAINILATCKALHAEGQRYLWQENNFTFTTPEAVRHFAELDAGFRVGIQHATFRIKALYWDDEVRKYIFRLDDSYRLGMRASRPLTVSVRPKESFLNRGGFRCYTWKQLVDFLGALRAPFDPSIKPNSKLPRSRLLPSLSSLRIDLVNFPEDTLPFSDHALHDVANHDLGCTLDELQVTGMPRDDSGQKANAELRGMLKVNGLLLQTEPSYIFARKKLEELPNSFWCALIRPEDSHTHQSQKTLVMPEVPKEPGYPETTPAQDARFSWKRMPRQRDSQTREWHRFSRITGLKLLGDCSGDDSDSDYDAICPCCGDSHLDLEDFYDEDGLMD